MTALPTVDQYRLLERIARCGIAPMFTYSLTEDERKDWSALQDLHLGYESLSGVKARNIGARMVPVMGGFEVLSAGIALTHCLQNGCDEPIPWKVDNLPPPSVCETCEMREG